MMIGGEAKIVKRLDPIFQALAPGLGSIDRTPGRKGRDPRPEQGYAHTGPAGAGHFVKMGHNGIEYGLMQAYAEGFDILRGKGGDNLPEEERFDIDLADVAEVWRRGSVISSWLLDLTSIALTRIPNSLNFPAMSMIPAKAAGPSMRPSKKRCQPMFKRCALCAVSLAHRSQLW